MNQDLAFIHGWGVDQNIWHEFSEQYFKSFTVHHLAIQDYFQASQDIDQNVQNIAKQIGSRLSNDTVIIAWSMGAIFAVKACAMFRQKRFCLILICSNPCFTQRSNWPYGIRRELVIEMKENLQQRRNKTLSKFYALVAKGSEDVKNVIKKLKASVNDSVFQNEFLMFGLEALEKTNFLSNLINLNNKTVMCFAENDTLVNKQLFFLKPIAGNSIQYELIENACHAPFICSPEQTAETIKKHL